MTCSRKGRCSARNKPALFFFWRGGVFGRAVFTGADRGEGGDGVSLDAGGVLHNNWDQRIQPSSGLFTRLTETKAQRRRCEIIPLLKYFRREASFCCFKSKNYSMSRLQQKDNEIEQLKWPFFLRKEAANIMSLTDISLSETHSTKHHIITSAALRIVSTRSIHPPFLCIHAGNNKIVTEVVWNVGKVGQTEHWTVLTATPLNCSKSWDLVRLWRKVWI